ncbi:MAG: flippase-like domain-containing protein, partial [Chloroflexi bacterium]|nr:flippase-like domain-containing protein [Chloroflexota bacterium]
MKRWQTLLIGIGVSALALFFVFRQADLSRIAAAFQQARYEYILLTALIYVGLVLIRGYRWHILTERRLSFGDAFWLFNIGFLLNNVLPAKLGEVARAVLAGRKPGMQFGRAASSVVVERLFDLVAVVTQLTVAILLLDLPQWATNAAVIGGVGSFTLVGVLAYAARNPEGALTLGGRLLAILPFFDRDQADDFLQ